jgi:hypothetical protein
MPSTVGIVLRVREADNRTSEESVGVLDLESRRTTSREECRDRDAELRDAPLEEREGIASPVPEIEVCVPAHLGHVEPRQIHERDAAGQ